MTTYNNDFYYATTANVIAIPPPNAPSLEEETMSIGTVNPVGDHEMPDPETDYERFAAYVDRLMRKEKLQWNPMKKKTMPWIDIKEVNKKYGDEVDCVGLFAPLFSKCINSQIATNYKKDSTNGGTLNPVGDHEMPDPETDYEGFAAHVDRLMRKKKVNKKYGDEADCVGLLGFIGIAFVLSVRSIEFSSCWPKKV